MTDSALMLSKRNNRGQNTHPMTYKSVFPSPTFSPSKEVMSSGGVAEPTFQVITCTLLEKGVT